MTMADSQLTEIMRRNVLLGVMLTFLAILYLNNGFACQRQSRRLFESRERLRQTEYRYYTVQKRFNNIGVRSAVKQRLTEAESPLRDSKKPNVRLEVRD